MFTITNTRTIIRRILSPSLRFCYCYCYCSCYCSLPNLIVLLIIVVCTNIRVLVPAATTTAFTSIVPIHVPQKHIMIDNAYNNLISSYYNQDSTKPTFHKQHDNAPTTGISYKYSSSKKCNYCYQLSWQLFMGKGDGKKKRPKQSSASQTSSSTSMSSSVSSTSSSSPKSSPKASSSTSSSTSASSSSMTTPLRVTSNSIVPVRQQLRWAQLNKEYEKAVTSGSFRQPAKKTSYRRTWDEDEIIEKAEQRKKRGQDPDWDIILSRTALNPLVIVDGYNIIYKWIKLQKHMSTGHTQHARQLLIDELENLSFIKGWRVEVVFDGARRKSGISSSSTSSSTGSLSSSSSSNTINSNGQSTQVGSDHNQNNNNINFQLNSGSVGGPGAILTSVSTSNDKHSKKDVSKYGVRVVYTGAGIEADTYIEQRCAEAKANSIGSSSSSNNGRIVVGGEYSGNFIIATDDTMIRLAAINAGAMCMSSNRFVQELKACKSTITYRLETTMSKINGTPLRPTKLHGTQIYTGTRFGKNSILIEDKRNRTKTTSTSSSARSKVTLPIPSSSTTTTTTTSSSTSTQHDEHMNTIGHSVSASVSTLTTHESNNNNTSSTSRNMTSTTTTTSMNEIPWWAQLPKRVS